MKMISISKNVRSVAAGAAMLLIAGPVLAACGSSGSKVTVAQTLPSAWSRAAKKDVTALAVKIRSSDAKACKPVVFLAPGALATAYERYGWNIAPRAVANCDAFSNTFEIATFASEANRDDFVKERSESICRRATAVNAPLPPFQWATGTTSGANWSVQGDTRSGVDRVAKRLSGEASTFRCPKNETLGWKKTGIANVRAVAQRITTSQIKCDGFALIEQAKFLEGRAGAKTPTALGACVSTDGKALFVAGFDKASMPKEAFIAEILSNKTVCASPSQAVIGRDWVVIAPAPLAAVVVTKIGGTLGATCGGA